MDKRFLDAFIDPAPFRLLGRSLYPWCLKYRVRLTAFNSPLLSGEREPTPADLIFALQVCAEEPLGGPLGWKDNLRIILMTRRPDKFATYLKAFLGYALVNDWPKFWEQSKNKAQIDTGVPWPLAILANLVEAGIDEKRAWEMPECQAIWWNSAFAIRNGAEVKIMTPEEEAYMASVMAAKEAKDNAAVASKPARVEDPNNGSIP